MKKRIFVFCLPILSLLVLVSEVTPQAQTCFPQIPRPCMRGMAPNKQRRYMIVRIFGKQVLCDTLSQAGGWIVIQRRLRNSGVTDFNQNWQKYKTGFGLVCQDHWIGLNFLHNLTGRINLRYQLKITLKMGTISHEVFYDDFKVDSESKKFQLSLGAFKGSIDDDFSSHNGAGFATPDSDNELQCACFYKTGWWFHKCFDVNLNGQTGDVTGESMGAIWDSLTKQTGTLDAVEMSIRRM